MSIPEPQTASALPLQAVFVSLAIHSLWGGNPVAVKFGLMVFPPMWSAFVRFFIAILCILIWAKWRGVTIWPRSSEWRLLLILSLLFFVQIALMNIGFNRTTGSIGATLISTNPLFAALAAHFIIVGDRLNVRKSAGLVIAFAGVTLVLWSSAGMGDWSAIGTGGLIVLISAWLLGTRLVVMAKILQEVDEVRVVIWPMILSLPIFAGAGMFWETIQWENLGFAPVAGLIYQGVVIAGLGFMVVSYLMKRYTPSVVSSFNFVAPVSGVLLSVALLGDMISWGIVAGVVLVGGGLYLVARPKPL